MGNLVQLGTMIGIWIAGIVVLSVIQASLQTEAEATVQRAEAKEQTANETFPKRYSFFYYAGDFIVIATIVFLGFDVFPQLITPLRNWLYSSGAMLVLPMPIDSTLNYFLTFPFLFLLVIFGRMLVVLVGQLSPTYARFRLLKNDYGPQFMPITKAEDKEAWAKARRLLDTNQLMRQEWIRLLKMGLMVWAIALPIIILTVDNYTKITSAGVITNPLTAVIETAYPWDSIANATLSLESEGSFGSGAPYVRPTLHLTTTNGSSILLLDARDADADRAQFLKVLHILHDNQVTLIPAAPDAEQETVLETYSQTRQEFWSSLVDYVNATHAPQGGGVHRRGSR